MKLDRFRRNIVMTALATLADDPGGRYLGPHLTEAEVRQTLSLIESGHVYVVSEAQRRCAVETAEALETLLDECNVTGKTRSQWELAARLTKNQFSE